MTDETKRPEDDNSVRVGNINPLPPFAAGEAPAPPQSAGAQPAGAQPADAPPAPPANSTPADAGSGFDFNDADFEDDLPPDNKQFGDRLERLGGEPAPAISPEEFARLQQAGQIHIDSRGRIRAQRREETDAGMSLRKRRAWYGAYAG